MWVSFFVLGGVLFFCSKIILSLYVLCFSTTMVSVGIFILGGELFYTNIPSTSAVSSTNFGSILIFASCVVGTCNILCG